ncbi:nucleotide disphospho-sugar-binding domain-containing protein [Streptomyces varsoviensis]|uniref:nucleotide disphospho-sugar-binding domain-containing protein n=1 Tax=Streptomyces varsoviensis TaxID=67373 RepID=UPI0033F6B320
MRVLIGTGPLCGHFFPLVPLAWALRAAGHEVRVAAPGDFSPTVVAAGLPAAPTAAELPFARFMFHDRSGAAVPPPAPGTDRATRLTHSGRGWGRLAAGTLDGTLDLVERWRPDLVVSEATEYAGQLAGAARGVPTVRIDWLSAMPEYRVGARAELAAELDALGLGDGLPEPPARLSLRPDPADGAAALRYVPYSGRAVQPDWALAPRERPRVCLTLGSMLPTIGRLDFPGRLAGLMDALTGRGLEVVVAVDEGVARRWDPLPPGVRAAGWLPLELVAPACDVVIDHGGMGSTLTAAAHGVPQVVLPQTADQFANADWLTDQGAGLALPPDAADTAEVADACTRLLDEPRWAKGGAALADRIAAQPSPAAVVPLLERLAR